VRRWPTPALPRTGTPEPGGGRGAQRPAHRAWARPGAERARALGPPAADPGVPQVFLRREQKGWGAGGAWLRWVERGEGGVERECPGLGRGLDCASRGEASSACSGSAGQRSVGSSPVGSARSSEGLTAPQSPPLVAGTHRRVRSALQGEGAGRGRREKPLLTSLRFFRAGWWRLWLPVKGPLLGPAGTGGRGSHEGSMHGGGT